MVMAQIFLSNITFLFKERRISVSMNCTEKLENVDSMRV